MNWLISRIQEIFSELSSFFATPMFEIGKKQYSLSFLFTLILVIIAVFWVSRIVSNWLKRGILSRVGFDRGTREVVATLIQYF